METKDTRDNKLDHILSDIVIDANVDTVNLVEAFQNVTLRPILKFQNLLLARYFEEYAESRKFKIHGSRAIDIQQFIVQSFSNDRNLRTFYMGLICGYFNSNELEFYILHKKEINKRISTMMVKRLLSTFVS